MDINEVTRQSDHARILDIWENPSGKMCMVVEQDSVSIETGEREPGYYTGYTQTVLEHEDLHLDGYTKPKLQVHGGITYGPDTNGWIGFDYNHAGDVCVDENGDVLPACIGFLVSDDPEMETRYSPQDVKSEVNSVSQQLTELEEFNGYDDE